ncbi:MAG: hypothetical protein IPG50_36975 [Myxococcales bacterium]|nr:hypothetical protein [Myxococcales bacterium]
MTAPLNDNVPALGASREADAPDAVPWVLRLSVVIPLGIVLFYASLRTGFFLDDFSQSLMVEGRFPALRGPTNLYDFVEPSSHALLAPRGLLPWWFHPDLQIRFFRPLASALLYADHRLFGHAPLPFHLHSLLWWVLAIFSVRGLLLRSFSPRQAALATAIFALSPCHSLPLAWIANREALLAITFGTLGLSAHRSLLDGGRFKHAALAALAFFFALLGGGEYGLAFFGYVLASLVVRSASPKRRAAGIFAFLIPASVYMGARTALHYGAAGSGFYADPLREPLTFLRSAPFRFVAQLSDGWLTIGSVSFQTTAERWGLVAIVLMAAMVVARPIRDALRSLPERQREEATRLLLGSLFALVPTLAVVPAMRLLGASMVGIALTSAVVIERAWLPREGAAKLDPLASGAALLLGFAQLVHGPGTSFLEARHHRAAAQDFADRVDVLAKAKDPKGGRALVVVRGSPLVYFAPFALEVRGAPATSWTVLSQSGRVLLLRTGERSIDLVTARTGALYPAGERNLYRDDTRPFKVGDVLPGPGIKVTVLEMNDIGPWRIRVDFDENPEEMLWVADTYKEMVEIALPPIGKGLPID